MSLEWSHFVVTWSVPHVHHSSAFWHYHICTGDNCYLICNPVPWFDLCPLFHHGIYVLCFITWPVLRVSSLSLFLFVTTISALTLLLSDLATAYVSIRSASTQYLWPFVITWFVNPPSLTVCPPLSLPDLCQLYCYLMCNLTPFGVSWSTTQFASLCHYLISTLITSSASLGRSLINVPHISARPVSLAH